jgi:hypothetical protein
MVRWWHGKGYVDRLSQKDSWNWGTKGNAQAAENMVVIGINRIPDFN